MEKLTAQTQYFVGHYIRAMCSLVVNIYGCRDGKNNVDSVIRNRGDNGNGGFVERETGNGGNTISLHSFDAMIDVKGIV